jgi:hypothetical protein
MSTTRTAIMLGDTLTIALAISVLAQYTGPCYVEHDGNKISPERRWKSCWSLLGVTNDTHGLLQN